MALGDFFKTKLLAPLAQFTKKIFGKVKETVTNVWDAVRDVYDDYGRPIMESDLVQTIGTGLGLPMKQISNGIDAVEKIGNSVLGSNKLMMGNPFAGMSKEEILMAQDENMRKLAKSKRLAMKSMSIDDVLAGNDYN
jgi:hypothetical protein